MTERVKIAGQLYTLENGKLIAIEPRKSVSQRLRERNSKRQKPVSRSKSANFNLIGKG